jgi:tetratricopeptide (TPR) repeat protein
VPFVVRRFAKLNNRAQQSYENAVTCHRQGRLADAEQHYRAALALAPDHTGVLHGLGMVCFNTGQLDEAIFRLEQVLEREPNHRGALLGLGDAFGAAGRQRDAEEVLERLLALEKSNAGAHFAIGQIRKQLGKFELAREAFAGAVAIEPTNPSYQYALAESAPFAEGDPRLAALEALAKNQSRYSDGQKAELHFALFKAYDELNRPEEAIAHLTTGNRVYRSLVPYQEAEVIDLFRELKEVYTAEAIATYGGAGHSSEVPVFVVGMPRSGTTLVEQILASHPDVFGAGELLYVQDLILGGFAGFDYPADLAALGGEGLRRFGGYYTVRLSALAPKAKRIIDKLPANFRHLGLLHLAMPKARFVHVVRDARDTCFSCYTQLFASGLNYAYDLGELGRYYKASEDLMAHWRQVLPQSALLDISYENLISDFETEARRLIAFCGLEWNEAVLRFHETDRAVRTRSEYQVRRPLYRSSIGRWRRYEQWLAPLLAALAEPSA